MKNLLLIGFFTIGLSRCSDPGYRDKELAYEIKDLVNNYNDHDQSSFEKIENLVNCIHDPNFEVKNKTLLGICIEECKKFENSSSKKKNFKNIVLKLLKKGSNSNKKGASPNKKSNNEYPIIMAIKLFNNINWKIIDMLCEYGADVYVEDESGNTPLMLLLNPNKYGKHIANQEKLKNFISKYNVDINRPNSKGFLPLNEFIKSLKSQIKILEEYEYKPIKFIRGEYYNPNFLIKYEKILKNKVIIKQKVRVLVEYGANFNEKDCLGTSAFDLLKNEKDEEFFKCYVSELIVINLSDLKQLTECEDYNVKILAYTRRFQEIHNKNISEETGSFLIQFFIINNKNDILKSLKYSGASLDISIIENIKTIIDPSGPWYKSYNLLDNICEMISYIKEDIVNDFFIDFSKNILENKEFISIVEAKDSYLKNEFYRKVIKKFITRGLNISYKNRDGISVRDIINRILPSYLEYEDLESYSPKYVKRRKNEISLKVLKDILYLSLPQNAKKLFINEIYERDFSENTHEQIISTFQEDIDGLASYLFRGINNKFYFQKNKFPNYEFANYTFFRLIINHPRINGYKGKIEGCGYAYGYGSLLKVLKLFLKAGLDINKSKKSEHIPIIGFLKYSVMNLDLFKFLVDNGAKLNVKDKENNSLIMLVIKNLKESGKDNISAFAIIRYIISNCNVDFLENNSNKENIVSLIFNEELEENETIGKIREDILLDQNLRNILKRYVNCKNLFLGSYYTLFSEVEIYRMDSDVLDLIIQIVKCAFSDKYYRKNKQEIHKRIMEKI